MLTVFYHQFFLAVCLMAMWVFFSCHLLSFHLFSYFLLENCSTESNLAWQPWFLGWEDSHLYEWAKKTDNAHIWHIWGLLFLLWIFKKQKNIQFLENNPVAIATQWFKMLKYLDPDDVCRVMPITHTTLWVRWFKDYSEVLSI